MPSLTMQTETQKPHASPPSTLLESNIAKLINNSNGPKAIPRMASVMASLTNHLHDFCKENNITAEEFAAGIELVSPHVSADEDQTLILRRQLNWSGRMSNPKRDETNLLANMIGLESLVDDITYNLNADGTTRPTVLGPFWREGAPRLPMGSSIVHGIEDADFTWMHGKVTDSHTGQPIENANIDIWETAPNGMYEQQDPEQEDMNLRGIFTTGPDGAYDLYCLRPTTYSIPVDGPAGKLLQLLDRHTMRPAHIHIMLIAPGYRTIISELFDRRDKHVYDDAAAAVKEELIVDFIPRHGDPKAQFELEYEFKMARTA